MEFTALSIDEKKSILQQLIQSSENEIYRCCVSLGIDPETFDSSTYTFTLPISRPEPPILQHAIETLNSAKERLSSLS